MTTVVCYPHSCHAIDTRVAFMLRGSVRLGKGVGRAKEAGPGPLEDRVGNISNSTNNNNNNNNTLAII